MDRCALIGCALVIARRGETTHSGVDVNNTHLSMINPLNKMWRVQFGGIAGEWKKRYIPKAYVIHYSEVIMSVMACLITGVAIVYSTVYIKISKLRVTVFCERNSPMTGEFPAQRASTMENVCIWWHHFHGVNVQMGQWTKTLGWQGYTKMSVILRWTHS